MPSFIVVYSIIITAIEPRFLSWGNLDNLASQIAPLLVMSVGQSFTIISGGLDLSMASVMSLSGVVANSAGSSRWRLGGHFRDGGLRPAHRPVYGLHNCLPEDHSLYCHLGNGVGDHRRRTDLGPRCADLHGAARTHDGDRLRPFSRRVP